jgi:hypothetical protein
MDEVGIKFGGERGIRTLDTLLTYTHFPGVLLKPLGHFTKATDNNQKKEFCQATIELEQKKFHSDMIAQK